MGSSCTTYQNNKLGEGWLVWLQGFRQTPQTHHGSSRKYKLHQFWDKPGKSVADIYPQTDQLARRVAELSQAMTTFATRRVCILVAILASTLLGVESRRGGRLTKGSLRTRGSFVIAANRAGITSACAFSNRPCEFMRSMIMLSHWFLSICALSLTSCGF